MRFYVSDNHFGHLNIIKYCSRPFLDSAGRPDVHYMNKIMTEKWNSAVRPEDTVFHMGDFSMGQPGKYREKLNGKIILLKGNHDKYSQIVGHFDEIHDRLEIEIAGRIVLLGHHPYKDTVDEYSNKFINIMPERKNNQWLLSGHTHNSKPKINYEKKIINCCVEWWDYSPISEIEIEKIINSN